MDLNKQKQAETSTIQSRKHLTARRQNSLRFLVGFGGTDGLIDQIVYRLYGLMEEEVKVVEQTS